MTKHTVIVELTEYPEFEVDPEILSRMVKHALVGEPAHPELGLKYFKNFKVIETRIEAGGRDLEGQSEAVMREREI